MNPNLVRELLKGHQDAISEETVRDEAFYKKLTCPICYERGGCEKRLRQPKITVDEESGTTRLLVSPFSSDDPLPQGYAHCIHCGTDFDPNSGIIFKTDATSIMPVDSDPASTIVVPPLDPHQE